MSPSLDHLVVAVAVIQRGEEVLLACRPVGKEHAGLWEFPGGKFDEGESLGEALRRELNEELGIEVADHKELMDIEHRYAEYRVTLRVALVEKFTGEARGMENQDIAWVRRENLDHYDFPEANKAILEKLAELWSS